MPGQSQISLAVDQPGSVIEVGSGQVQRLLTADHTRAVIHIGGGDRLATIADDSPALVIVQRAGVERL